MEDPTRLPGRPQDLICVNDLHLEIFLASGASWPKGDQATLQPVSISLSIPHDISRAALLDDLTYSINYAELTHAIRDSLGRATFQSLEDVCSHVFDILLPSLSKIEHNSGELNVKIVQLKAPLHCKEVGVNCVSEIQRDKQCWRAREVRHFIKDLIIPTTVGINQCEKEEKQDVCVNLRVNGGIFGLLKSHWVDFRQLARQLYEEIGQSRNLTLEALASSVASIAIRILSESIVKCSSEMSVTVTVAKPSALVFAKAAEVEITRAFSPNVTSEPLLRSLEFDHGFHRVAIALGSNLGDRFYNIELALRLLESPEEILSTKHLEDVPFPARGLSVAIVDTSFMYESAPMYVTDQPRFINCACMIETNMEPVVLLFHLKEIERIVGRVASVRNGPRAVDLDIILYDDIIFDNRLESQRNNLDNLEGNLVIPHPRMAEREFVLRPLNNMIPDYIHPVEMKPISILLADLIPEAESGMTKVIPFPRYPLPKDYSSPYFPRSPVPPTLHHWTYPVNLEEKKRQRRKTHVMATLNATPDSFSDGSLHNSLQTAMDYARKSVEAGATIVDVGGYSTRPGAAFVSVDEEINRVVPIIQAIREAKPGEGSISGLEESLSETPIRSIPSAGRLRRLPYRLAQTEEGRKKAAEYTRELRRVATSLAVPVILMHSRGDAGQNKDYNSYLYAGSEETVIEGIKVELGEKIEHIIKGKGGVRRWLVISDPGIGFSKTLEGNLEVLRGAARITTDASVGSGINKRRNLLVGYPQLIGVSRKSFLGAILASGEHGRHSAPKERVWATAAAVACAVQQKALVVRVHDTKEMKDVVQVSDALWS